MAVIQLSNSKGTLDFVRDIAYMEPFRTKGYEGTDWYIKVKAPEYFLRSSIFKDKVTADYHLVVQIESGTVSFIKGNLPVTVSRFAKMRIE